MTLLDGVDARALAPPARVGARAAGAPRKQLHQPGVERRAAACTACAPTQPQGQACPKAISPAHEILAGDRRRIAHERRHRHARAGDCRRARSGPRSGDGRPSRVARPHRRDLRRRRARRSPPARIMPRTSSTACRRSRRDRPGVVGAVLESDAVAAEIICDGHHVHPSLVVDRDSRQVGVAHDGDHRRAPPSPDCRTGSRARLGDQTIIAGDRTAVLEDGTLAGSILTMDGAFRMLVTASGCRCPMRRGCARRRRPRRWGCATSASIAPGNGPISWSSTPIFASARPTSPASQRSNRFLRFLKS